MVKKIGVFLVLVLSLILTLNAISALVEVTSTPVSVVSIPELNKPALFSVDIKNLDSSDNFQVYSLASANLMPNESFFIAAGDTKTVQVEVYPTLALKTSPDYYSLEYKIKGEQSPIQVQVFVITLLAPKDAFDITFEDINPDSTNAVVTVKNKYGGPIDNIVVTFNSPLFSDSQTFSLSANEEKKLSISLNPEKVKSLYAGEYIVDIGLKIGEVSASKSSVIEYKEREGISTTESLEGKIMRRYEIEKRNNGNTKTEVTIAITRNLFASLFTSFNLVPAKKELSGFHVTYVFRKELSPNDGLKVIAKTNWWILLGIIIAIGIIYYLIDRYVKNKIVLKKRVSFVRTKGGEFALKVTLTAKARDFVERIRIIDRLPPMLKVFERFGMAGPEKIDPANRRLEWTIQALSAGEERVMSYIVYSKIGVMGRFELPSAEAIYEFQGKIKEAQSNRAIYVNEPAKRE
jgi:hypothetical protein